MITRAIIAATACILAAQSTAQAADPWSRAALYRDQWGVPHVYAVDIEAMAYAFGYAQAEDHLDEMLFAYRVVLGGASEIWGEEYVDSDMFSLRMRHGALAEEYLISGDAMTRDLCNGFAAGVNDWMLQHPRQTPDWAAPVPPAAPLALLHAYFMSFAPMDAPSIWRRAPAAATGAAFALAPDRTHEGNTTLAFAMHGGYTSPFRWYEAHLTNGGALNVYGATIYGLPIILAGHSGQTAWAFVPNQSDFADVYLTPRGGGGSANPPAPNQFNTRQTADNTQWAAYVLANTRLLNVRTAAGIEPRPVECLMGAEGPVMGEVDGKLAVWRVGGYWQLGGMRQLMAMAIAPDYAAFEQALSWRQIPCFHIIAADADAGIAYLYNSTVGEKQVLVEESFFGPGGPVGHNPSTVWLNPIDGTDARLQWGPVMGLDTLPSIRNPGSGYVQAAGNPPWRAEHTGNIIRPDNFPPWFIQDSDTPRASRMRDLLRHGKRTFDDAQRILFDTHVPAAGPLTARLLAIADREPGRIASAHPDAPEAITILREWTRAAEPDSVGMTLFQAWWWAMEQRVSDLGLPLYPALREATLDTEESAQFMLTTLATALDAMRNQFGEIALPWGDVHVIRRGTREAPMPGAVAGGAVWASAPGVFDGQVWPVSGGVTYAMAVSIGEATRAASVVPFGASERHDSAHYDDQLDLFLGRRMKDTIFTVDDMQRDCVSGYGRAVYLRAAGVPGSVAVFSDIPVNATVTSSPHGPQPPISLAPFSLQLTPAVQEKDVPVSFQAWLRVPETLVRDEHLYAVALFRYAVDEGWSVMKEQRLDPETRILEAFDEQMAARYAIFAPEEFRVAPPDAESPDVAIDAMDDVQIAQGPTAMDLGTYAPLAPLKPAAPRNAPPGGEDDPDPLLLGNQRFIGKNPPKVDPNAPEGNPLAGLLSPGSGKSEDHELTYDTRDITDWVSGKDITLQAPDTSHRLNVRAKTLIRARCATLNAPPLPLPAGLRAYSDYVGAEHEPKPARTEVFISISPIEPSDVNNEKLRIFACSAKRGWYPLPQQRRNIDSGTFTALDAALHTYAILGPGE